VRRVVLLLVLGVLSAAPAAARGQDGLTPLPVDLGCVSVSELFGCDAGRGFENPSGAASISPDGRRLYVPSGNEAALAILRLDPWSGAVGQQRSRAGCLVGMHPDPPDQGFGVGYARTCRRVRGISDVAWAAAVSPDGRHLYVTATPSDPPLPHLEGNPPGIHAVLVLRRTAAGGLRQLPGRRGCVANRRFEGCAVSRRLRATSISIGPDGRHVYVAGRNTFSVFSRDPASGALEARSCLDPAGTDGCGPFGHGLNGMEAPVFSADGTRAYMSAYRDVVDDHARSVWALIAARRDALSGALEPLSGPLGCVAGGELPACALDRRLGAPGTPVVAPGGRDVYAASFQPDFDADRQASVAGFRTGAAGELLAADAPCLSASAIPGCSTDAGLVAYHQLAGTPDGRWLLAAGEPGVVLFARDPLSGVVRRVGTVRGCRDAFAPCRADAAIDTYPSIVIAPSGRFAYAVSDSLYGTGTVAALAIGRPRS
jgi:hypothetical protein